MSVYSTPKNTPNPNQFKERLNSTQNEVTKSTIFQTYQSFLYEFHPQLSISGCKIVNHLQKFETAPILGGEKFHVFDIYKVLKHGAGITNIAQHLGFKATFNNRVINWMENHHIIEFMKHILGIEVLVKRNIDSVLVDFDSCNTKKMNMSGSTEMGQVNMNPAYKTPKSTLIDDSVFDSTLVKDYVSVINNEDSKLKEKPNKQRISVLEFESSDEDSPILIEKRDLKSPKEHEFTLKRKFSISSSSSSQKSPSPVKSPSMKPKESLYIAQDSIPNHSIKPTFVSTSNSLITPKTTERLMVIPGAPKKPVASLQSKPTTAKSSNKASQVENAKQNLKMRFYALAELPPIISPVVTSDFASFQTQLDNLIKSNEFYKNQCRDLKEISVTLFELVDTSLDIVKKKQKGLERLQGEVSDLLEL